jgi:hypothetical protein
MLKPTRGEERGDGYAVILDDRGVTVRGPGGAGESLPWAELRAVEIVTTDAGPWAEDVFWLLHGREGGIAVPQGAEGMSALLERLQALPGFDNGAVLRAMASTENVRFPVWRAPRE